MKHILADCYEGDYDEDDREEEVDDFCKCDPITGKRGHSILNKRHPKPGELDDVFNDWILG